MKNAIKLFSAFALTIVVFSAINAEPNAGPAPYRKQTFSCVTPQGQAGSYWTCMPSYDTQLPLCPRSQWGQISQCIANEVE